VINPNRKVKNKAITITSDHFILKRSEGLTILIMIEITTRSITAKRKAPLQRISEVTLISFEAIIGFYFNIYPGEKIKN